MHPSSQPTSQTTTPATSRARRYDRPRELAGWTWRIDLDGARIYLVVNHDGDRIVEVFVSNGPLSPSVGLLASKMLQHGFDVVDIARLLDKVTGTHSIVVEGRISTSAEQAVAEYLRIAERRLQNLKSTEFSGPPS